MAVNQKITEFAALSSAAADDLLAIVDDPSGGAATKKIVVSDLIRTYKTTPEETSEGVTPTDFTYESGDWRRYGAIDGGGDASVAANNAHKLKHVILPDGDYTIANTVNGRSAQTITAGRHCTIIPTITDGSPVFDYEANTQIEMVGQVFIDSGEPVATAINCIGWQQTETGGGFGRRSILDIKVVGCAVGVDVDGFLHDARIIVNDNTLGFRGNTLNGSRIYLIAEGNVKHFEITSSNGFRFDVAAEGANAGYSPSTIDSCDGFEVLYYFEQAQETAGYLIIGGTTECRNFKLGPGRVSGLNALIVPIALDRCIGVDIYGFFSSGNSHANISQTANTKNVRWHASTSFGWLHDDNQNFAPALNHWPNPRFEHWLAGWDVLDPTNVAISKETTTVRYTNAVKILIDAAATNAFVKFKMDSGTDIAVALRSKTVLVGAWIYIPDDSYFDESLASASRGLPRVLGVSNNGASSINSQSILTGSSTSQYGVKGTWNLMLEELAVQSDCTNIFIHVYGNNGGLAAPDGTKFVLCGEVFLIEGGERQKWKAENGLYIDSDQNPVRVIGGKLVMRRDSAATDVDLTYAVGDRFEKPAPVTGGNLGVVCTTAGVGGTARFMRFGGNSTEVVTTTNVITDDETGKTFYLDTAGGFTSTLPAPAIGLKFKFIVSTAPTTAYIITTDSGDNILQGTFLDIVGELEAIIDQDTLNFVASTSLVGDSLDVESDGTNWYCTARSLADGGITVSV